METGQLDAAEAFRFILGGNATVTFESKSTGARFTYRVRVSEDGSIHFVSVLTGENNETDYAYLGTIRGAVFNHGKKSKIGADAPSAKAFAWAFPALAGGKMPTGLNVWHEGRCGRCNRKLTVPESIASGFGPECAGRI
jgi:hypothetical protein